MPVKVLSTLHMLAHLSLPEIPSGRYSYNLPFAPEEIEAQTGEITCPRSHSKLG